MKRKVFSFATVIATALLFAFSRFHPAPALAHKQFQKRGLGPRSIAVYNIQVGGEHFYFSGASQIRAHNASLDLTTEKPLRWDLSQVDAANIHSELTQIMEKRMRETGYLWGLEAGSPTQTVEGVIHDFFRGGADGRMILRTLASYVSTYVQLGIGHHDDLTAAILFNEFLRRVTTGKWVVQGDALLADQYKTFFESTPAHAGNLEPWLHMDNASSTRGRLRDTP